MEKRFVTYEIAKKLKDIGFDEKCIGYFNRKGELICGPNVSDEAFLFTNIGKVPKCCLTPLWQQAIEFLSEQYNILIYIDFTPKESYFYRETKLGYSLYHIDSEAENENKINFYEAREQAILKAIELIQSKTKAGEDE